MTIAAPDDIILDAVSDIILDADGGDIRFKDAGVEYGRINNNSSGNFLFLNPISDKDIIFKGNDGGTEFVALTLDMSDAGTAIFNHHLSIPDYITHYQDASTRFGFSGASTFVVNTGGTTALTIDSSQDATFAGNIELDNKQLQLTGRSSCVVLSTGLSAGSQIGSGTVINWGSTSVTQGKYYYWKSSSVWEEIDANSASKAIGLIAYARVTTTASAGGMLTQGIVYDATHGFVIGSPLYISAGATGVISNTVPSGSGDIVRVIGYALDANHIYFNPSGTWVEID